MAGKKASPSKQQQGAARVTQSATNGRLVGLIDETDAHEFRRANTAFKEAVTSSKADAVKALKASGYLDSSGKLSKRYR